MFKPLALVKREVLRRQQFPNETKMIQSVDFCSRLQHERNPPSRNMPKKGLRQELSPIFPLQMHKQ